MHRLDELHLEALRLCKESGRVNTGRQREIAAERGAELDSEVEHLLELRRYGLISEVVTMPNRMDIKSRYYAAYATGITPEGERALRSYSEDPLTESLTIATRNAIAAELKSRARSTARDIGTLRSEQAGNGRFDTGFGRTDEAEILRQELEERLLVVTRRWLEATAADGRVLTPGFVAWLVEQVRACLVHGSTDLKGFLDEEIGNHGRLTRESYDSLIEQVLAPVTADLRLKGESRLDAGLLQPRREADHRLAIVNRLEFHEPVGAVQTGPGAVANVTQSVGVKTTELIAVLEKLRDEARSQDFEEAISKRVAGAIQEALEAARDPNPGARFTLRSALQDAARIIQTAAATPAFLQLIQQALTLLPQ